MVHGALLPHRLPALASPTSLHPLQVDVQLHRKLPHLVPLALLQYIASPSPSHSVPYLTQSHLDAIASMQLLRRGRLSVQVSRVVFPAFGHSHDEKTPASRARCI